MIRIWQKCFIGLGVVSVAGSALAGTWFTNYVAIDRLDNGDAGDAYRVYMNTTKQGKKCANSDYYEVYPTASKETKDLMNRTLLSALLAGKKVRLNLSTVTCGSNDRPAYTGVDVAKDQ